jgi:hypothetical protein
VLDDRIPPCPLGVVPFLAGQQHLTPHARFHLLHV